MSSKKVRWSAGEKIKVLVAVDQDMRKGFKANANVTCAVCQKPTLNYELVHVNYHLVTWCRHCKAGCMQGFPSKQWVEKYESHGGKISPL